MTNTQPERDERYQGNQDKRGLKRVQLWLPESDVANFQKWALKARARHAKSSAAI